MIQKINCYIKCDIIKFETTLMLNTIKTDFKLFALENMPIFRDRMVATKPTLQQHRI